MHWKGLFVIAVVAVVAIAVATRVAFLRNLILPAAPAATG
jgi:hypothetical protein